MTLFPTGDRYQDLWITLSQTRDAILKARRLELEKYGLTVRHSAVLRVIPILGEKATPKNIARLLFRTPHAISQLLDRMVKQGLIEKIRNAGGGNRIRVVLTEKGTDALEKTIERVSIHNIISSISDENCQQLLSLLGSLRKVALGEIRRHDDLPFDFSV